MGKVKMIFSVLLILININYLILSFDSKNETEHNNNINYHKILVILLVRNKGHTLPYFLSYFEGLDYPKHRIGLRIFSDHNEDNSLEVLNTWLNKTRKLYHHVDYYSEEEPKEYKNKTKLWPTERYEHLMNLKEKILNEARNNWTDFIFYLDADVFLTRPTTLKELIGFNLSVIAPMLKSDSEYSNYWYEVQDNYYFKYSLNYSMIYKRHEINNFKVPVIHSAVLIKLKDPSTKWLTFCLEKLHENQINYEHYSKKYEGPFHDVIIFSMSAKYFDVELHISNMYDYGYILHPLEEGKDLNYDLLQLENIKLEIIYDLDEAPKLNKELEKFVKYPEPNKLFLDHIYMINLNRRPKRRDKMELQFKELGLIVERFEAIDSKELQYDKLGTMGIKILPNYEDPITFRKMKLGEIGCFLSHYKIWEKIVELQQKEVLILEDDLKFHPFFRSNVLYIVNQARKIQNWDLLYLGRKPLEYKNEEWANDDKTLVYPKWTYWTLGYVITLNCARKLIDSKPLEKILPVDEYIPIMFNQHPNNTWKSYFENRNLLALSVYPTILRPAYYHHEEKFVSDTETSTLIEDYDYKNLDTLRDEL